MLQVELPFPPSVNHYWRLWRGRIVISNEGREYRKTVARLLRDRNVKPMTGQLAVAIAVFPPDRRRRDLDNLLKSVNDSLQHGGAFPDDSQIVWLLIKKATVVPGGMVVIRIRERR
jgi:crossover junction endodeoxyribonuclease RusA